MTTLNDRERRLWVENDESLYRWWQRSRSGLYRFVQDNRAAIDAHIRSILD